MTVWNRWPAWWGCFLRSLEALNFFNANSRFCNKSVFIVFTLLFVAKIQLFLFIASLFELFDAKYFSSSIWELLTVSRPLLSRPIMARRNPNDKWQFDYWDKEKKYLYSGAIMSDWQSWFWSNIRRTSSGRMKRTVSSSVASMSVQQVLVGLKHKRLASHI